MSDEAVEELAQALMASGSFNAPFVDIVTYRSISRAVIELNYRRIPADCVVVPKEPTEAILP